MTKQIFLFNCVIILSLFTSVNAFACSCAQPESPKIELEKSQAVFLATVSKPVKNEYGHDQGFTLNVKKTWKGDVKKVISTNSIRMGCAYWGFKENNDFLIYAHKSRDKNNPAGYDISMCSRTKKAEDAQIEMLYLDAEIENKDIEALNKDLPNKFSSDDANIRAESVKLSIEMLGTASKSDVTFKTLLKAVKDPDSKVVLQGIYGLSDYYLAKNETAINALLPLLKSENREIRMNSVHALKTIGKRNPAVFDVILDLATKSTYTDSKEDKQAISIISTALSEISDTKEQKKQAFDLMFANIDVLDSYAKITVIQHIGFMGKKYASSASQKLIQVLNETSHDNVRQYTIHALGNLQAEDAISSISRYLKDKNCYISAASTEALHKINTKQSNDIVQKDAMPLLIKNFKNCPSEYAAIFEQLKENAVSAIKVMKETQRTQQFQKYVHDRIDQAIKILETARQKNSG